MKHIMLDLETFATSPYSCILAIGAVHFDPVAGKTKSEFYVTIDTVTSQKVGFVIDADTVCWWLDPARRPAWDDYLRTVHFEPEPALMGFGQWIASLFDLNADPTAHDDVELPDDPAKRETFEVADHVAMWGNGAAFDCEILRNAYKRYGLPPPWSHWNDRCFRTLKNMAHYADVEHQSAFAVNAKALKPPHEGIVHNALIDARQQAAWLMSIAREFKLKLG